MEIELDDYLKHQEFLDHAGVKGMKWGVRKRENAVARANQRALNPDRFGNRNTKQFQNKVDRVREVASGRGSKADKARVALNTYNLAGKLANNSFSLKDVAKSDLDKSQKQQRAIKEGRRRTEDILLRLQGVDIRELNFDYDN